MELPVLKTKLHVPPLRPELVRRARLIGLLQAGVHSKLTLVSAPAGFGKTTLIGEWVSRCNRPTAWLSLEDNDNDPVRFLSYLVAALRTIQPGLAEGIVGDFQTLRRSVAESVMTGLLNEIAEIEESFALVLDDYHLIHDQTIHAYITFFLEHLPSQMHLVISTRADPPLPLTTLRAHGQLSELRAGDLRFTLEETAEFLSQLMGLNLSAEEIAILASHTEGWITGLQMAAVSMQGREDTSSFIESFTGSNRYILDYLVEEVLQQQSQGIQQFLLKTSILRRLNGPLCEAVTGQSGSQNTLEQLERENLFIVALDSERRWYRYHRLFADLLRRRVAQVLPEELKDLNRRASEWYENHGLVAEAIEQNLLGEDFKKAMQLIEDNAEESLMRSEFATFLNWVQALPEEMVCRRPRLCLYHALALLLNGSPMNDIQPRIAAALKGDSEQQVGGQLAAFRAIMAAIQGDVNESLNQCNLAMELLPADDHFFRSATSRVLVNVTYATSGDIEQAVRIFEESIRKATLAGNLTVAVASLSELGEVYMKAGRIGRAKSTYEHGLELAVDSEGRELPIAGLAMIGLGDLLRECNDLSAAEKSLNNGINLVQELGVIGALDGYIALARVKQAQGYPQEAEQVMDAVHKIATRFDASELDDLLVDLHRAHLWLCQGKTEAAVRWYNEWRHQSDRVEERRPYVLEELSQLFQARIELAQGNPAASLKILKQLEKTASKLGRNGVVIESLVVQCLAHRKLNDSEQALAALNSALILAESEGYMRIFLDEGPEMAQLLYEAANRGIMPEYTGRLLAAFPLSPESRKEASEELIEPLSPRELEVLRLLAEGASNKEVARRLYISLPTVKWHTSNIYGKLGVQNRMQAAAKARALGIVSNA